MKQILILQRERNKKIDQAYLGIEIVDLINGGINIASMDRSSYFYARLDGLLFERQRNVCLMGKLLGRPWVALTDEVIHNNKINVSAASYVSTIFLIAARWTSHRCVEADKVLRDQSNK
jgi:hypothetical protein